MVQSAEPGPEHGILVVRGDVERRPDLHGATGRRRHPRRGRDPRPDRRGRGVHRDRPHPGLPAHAGGGRGPGRPRHRVRRAARAGRRRRGRGSRRDRRPGPGERRGPRHAGLAGRPAARPRTRWTARGRGSGSGCWSCRGWRWSSCWCCACPRCERGEANEHARPPAAAAPPRSNGPRVDVTVLLAVALPLLAVLAVLLVRPDDPPQADFPPEETELTRATLICPSGDDDVLVASDTDATGEAVVRQGKQEEVAQVSPGRATGVRTGEAPAVVAAEGDLAPGLIAGRFGSPLVARRLPAPRLRRVVHRRRGRRQALLGARAGQPRRRRRPSSTRSPTAAAGRSTRRRCAEWRCPGSPSYDRPRGASASARRPRAARHHDPGPGLRLGRGHLRRARLGRLRDRLPAFAAGPRHQQPPAGAARGHRPADAAAGQPFRDRDAGHHQGRHRGRPCSPPSASRTPSSRRRA